ncbi:MAG: FtsX-like permease family protein [Actinomycetota bacterium]
MWKLTFKQIFARKIRFLLTTFAVILGVGFVVSTFALADSLRTTFDELAGDIESGIDLQVRASGDFASDFNRPPVDSSLLDAALAVDGVEAGAVNVGAVGVFIIDDDGDPIIPSGPPSFAANWVDVESVQQYFLAEGSEPEGPDEFVVNADAIEEYDLEIGNTYLVSGPVEQREFTLVGSSNFADPDEDKSVGAITSLFDTETTEQFTNLEGQAQFLALDVAEGADVDAVAQAVQAELGPSVEVATQEERVEATSDQFSDIVGIFNNVLLAFALITLFVAAFLVNNVFQIIVSQRVRELALLRAVGATSAQITRSIIGEALLVGIFSTVVGLGLGVLMAIGLQQILEAAGFGLPPGAVELRWRTVVFAAIVGIGITVLSALAPALRARQVPPVAAMREGFRLTAGNLRSRLIRGGFIAAIGFVLLALGLFGDLDTVPLLTSVALGAVLVFLGVNGLSPAFAAPVAYGLGRFIRGLFAFFGRIWAAVVGLVRKDHRQGSSIPVKLSQENAARTPRRTASTASALTIGLALVAMAAVIGDSIKSTFVETLDNAVESDFFVQPEGGGFGPGTTFSDEVITEIDGIDGVESVGRYRFGFNELIIEFAKKNVIATDLDILPDHIDPQVVEGSIDDLGPGDILIHEDPAADLGVSVGETIDVFFTNRERVPLEVAAIYEDSTILDNWVIDTQTWNDQIADRSVAFGSILLEEGADPATVQADLDGLAEEFPTIKVEDRTELKESTEDQLDSFLAVINSFLGLALLIAVMGIAITLSLSVFERTRELGLLRAVGMTKVQMRRMVRWEAVIVALFGAVIGVLLGVIFGIAASEAIPETVIKNLSIPVGQLISYFVIAALAGIAAAVFPAYRASRMKVLEAIAEE